LLQVAADILGKSLTDVCCHGGVWPVLFGTRFGEVAGVRFVLALLLGVLICWPAARMLQLVAGAGLIGLLAITGHAGATPGLMGTIHLAADIVHVLAASAWLGSLPALALLLAWAGHGRTPDRRAIATAAIGHFSVLGIVCVGALLASGLINSWQLLEDLGDLLTTGYGSLLSLKIGLFAAMVAIAAVNRQNLAPLLPAAETIGTLKRNSLAEAALGLGVLLLAAALGAMQPPIHLHISSAGVVPPDAAFVHIHIEAVMADVTIDPGQTGKSSALIRLWREDSTNFSALHVKLALDPQAATSKTVERVAILMPDGTWQVPGLDIPSPGIWLVRVTIDSSATEPIVLDAPIVITRCSNEC